MSECTVTVAVGKVQDQVGFEAVLLYSTLYPLVWNEVTSGLDFWKSTRKIVAFFIRNAGGHRPRGRTEPG